MYTWSTTRTEVPVSDVFQLTNMHGFDIIPPLIAFVPRLSTHLFAVPHKGFRQPLLLAPIWCFQRQSQMRLMLLSTRCSSAEPFSSPPCPTCSYYALWYSARIAAASAPLPNAGTLIIPPSLHYISYYFARQLAHAPPPFPPSVLLSPSQLYTIYIHAKSPPERAFVIPTVYFPSARIPRVHPPGTGVRPVLKQ